MYSKKVCLLNKSGLHARPASDFFNMANRFKSKITVAKEDETANAKSILFLISLGITMGTEIDIIADGIDEVEAVEALCDLVNSGFGE